MAPKALITGITGQDGCYLTELLVHKGYQVFGTSRSGEPPKLDENTPGGPQEVSTLSDTATSNAALRALIQRIQPDEIYHFAADSFVPNGWESPWENMRSNYGLTLSILEAMRHDCPQAKLVNACSREVFGGSASGLANESTPMRPNTPYGINKAASRWMVETYCRNYGLFATNAILFNHESPRRGKMFVTRKVSLAVAAIFRGELKQLELGSMTARRDWGFAGDYVEAMWRMLQADAPHDFVLGTGVTHSIQDLVKAAFAAVDLDWQNYVKGSADLVRENDENCLAADISAARKTLGWEPTVGFEELIQMMVQSDCQGENG